MKLYVSVFRLMSVFTVVKSAQLYISPSTNIQAGAPTLTVRCQATNASGVTSVYRLDISRLREGVITEQRLGTISVGKQPELGPGLTSPKYTVSGSISTINAVSTSFVQIVIQDPNCNDKGEYICKVSGGNSAGSLTPETRTNITVQENPSNVEMNVVPSRLQYEVNTSISMTCNGNVGNPAQIWQWQTRSFPASTTWNRYIDEADIVTDPVNPPSGTSCSYRQKTVLTYSVKSQDNGLEIRCILDNREEFSDNFTIYLTRMVSRPTMNMDDVCTQSLITDCRSSLKSSLSSTNTRTHACRILDTYFYCIQTCDNQGLMKQVAYKILSATGIQCGSAMVTLSGTMVMLMLFTTLRKLF